MIDSDKPGLERRHRAELHSVAQELLWPLTGTLRWVLSLLFRRAPRKGVVAVMSQTFGGACSGYSSYS